ncbi:MAG: glycosyltransferase, partial [Gemmatimonadaceae bacterium]
DSYAVANLTIARSGTMTLAELMAWHIPAVLVPLPTAAADHQTLNARALQDAGAAVHLPQSELSGARLGREVSDLLGNAARAQAMTAAAASRARPDAANEIARRIVALAEQPS